MVAGLDVGHSFAYFFHVTGRLVATDHRKGSNAMLAFKVMDITMTNRSGTDTYFYFASSRRVQVYILDHQWLPKFMKNGRFHLFNPSRQVIEELV